MNADKMTSRDRSIAALGLSTLAAERLSFLNPLRFVFADAQGNVFREEVVTNLVTTQGANDMLDKYFSGSAYTAAWNMGLISGASYGAGPVAADTAASHAGWLEAGGANAPTYTGPRKAASWAAASARSKALSAGLVFTFTGAGTVKGCFLSSASALDATTGILFSAGLFSGGDQPVVATNTLTVSYSVALGA